MKGQLTIFPIDTHRDNDIFSWKTVDDYDYCIIATSGGKDSTACLLYALEAGVDPGKIELWHHCVDGHHTDDDFMDWPVTRDYCRKLAEAFSIRLFYSWKEGGFKTEMLRCNDYTKPVGFETPTGTRRVVGTGGNKSTRLRFPQQSANLNTRYCSSYMKIDPAATGTRKCIQIQVCLF